ncbi:hypothetical protein [Kitasatospora sp. NPDC057500]|uniref:hypothetical protein n=1 Tax=Kitasatospora sp. NPDC057500 TaxID=3346151 RepID=UPI00368FCD8F
MTGTLLEALDAVAWEGLETGDPGESARDVSRALRRLALAGAAATGDDCYPLYSLVTREGRETPSATAVALPFVVAMAADPAMSTDARLELIELLVALQAPALAGLDRTQARALLADPLPAVRREALPLAGGTGQLLERWRTETDPTVRIPLLLALGEAVAAEAGGTGRGDDVDGARAVLTGLADGDDPLLRVAAVHAWAEFDQEAPVRQMDRLIEVYCEAAVRPRFEEAWYTPGVPDSWTREDLVRSTAWKLAHDPDAGLRFAVRLAETADRTQDAPLCRAALDVAWSLLTERRSVEAALLPLAGGLLASPDGAVRFRAANILAVLGAPAARYADRLAALLGDDAADEDLDGTVAEIARWALTRIGDPRALPGLVEQLRAQGEEQGRGYGIADPRRPDITEVLVPLRAHADVLLPAMRKAIREGGARGGATCAFLEVLKAWGEAALPALPDLLPLLADTCTSVYVLRILRGLGPDAASAAPALSTCEVLDHPGNHALVADTAECIGGDRAARLRRVGDAVMTASPPWYGPVDVLGEFGADAAPYAARVRFVMENSTRGTRLGAAVALWSITGRTGPSMRVLEEFVLPIADGGDDFRLFREALRALIRMGETTPAIRAALVTVRQSDRRLCTDGGYPMIVRDRELRALVDQALAAGAPS